MRTIKLRTMCGCFGLVVGLMLVGNGRLSAADWNQFRGPNRDNLSSETGLLDRWPDGGPERLWTATGLGKGYASVVNGKLYALGGNGDLTCCDSATGDVVWQKNILNDFGGSNITWGISESVLVDDGKVICSPGGSRASVVALNANNGSTEWVSNIPETPQASYASPVIARVGRVKQYVVFTSKGIVGVRAGDGQPMWGQNKS
ncbi:MAG: PQQ-binding-like beta-propeller repeat protein [Fuerstiella sp.]|nr:PQQ-binding-like beta-propeller repeat protein [Fuerstiella sp.]